MYIVIVCVGEVQDSTGIKLCCASNIGTAFRLYIIYRTRSDFEHTVKRIVLTAQRKFVCIGIDKPVARTGDFVSTVKGCIKFIFKYEVGTGVNYSIAVDVSVTLVLYVVYDIAFFNCQGGINGTVVAGKYQIFTAQLVYCGCGGTADVTVDGFCIIKVECEVCTVG